MRLLELCHYLILWIKKNLVFFSDLRSQWDTWFSSLWVNVSEELCGQAEARKPSSICVMEVQEKDFGGR